MQNILRIQCLNELLLSLQIHVESFVEIVKLQTAIALFKQGKISSGLAAKWLNMPRVNFFNASNGGRCRIIGKLRR